MYAFLEALDQRIWNLEQMIKEKETEVENLPEGIVNIARNGDKVHYYFKTDSSAAVRRYMRKDEAQMVKKLCQQDYDKKVITAAKKELMWLENIKKNYPDKAYERIYDKLNEQRKPLVRPVVLSNQDYVTEWESMPYFPKDFKEDTTEYYTDRGERVRSKTEILIANALNRNDIPYRYECPLYLDGYGMIHPDFTVLNIRRRKEFYWEHLGMMDDPVYSDHALQRIIQYQKNDLYPGEQLILTYETKAHPINSKTIDTMINRYLK